jgi:hypothetical protein
MTKADQRLNNPKTDGLFCALDCCFWSRFKKHNQNGEVESVVKCLKWKHTPQINIDKKSNKYLRCKICLNRVDSNI